MRGHENPDGLVARVLAARGASIALAAPLEIEDWVAQSMPDASPVKWHLSHTTWFFERFVLRPLGIPPVSDTYDFLFNSYYESVGSRQPRDQRGLLTRPTVAEVIAYRRAIDARLADLASSPRLAEVADALELGLHHEQQHQELLLTDVKHLFGSSPLRPVYRADLGAPSADSAVALAWHRFGGGVSSIGHDSSGFASAGHVSSGFAFDNESPRHQVFVGPFELASRLVTSAEYQAFVDDGGYTRAELWLSEGWAWLHANGIRAPLYWDLEKQELFTLGGQRAIAGAEPVCHVTYYEADAYARWAGARLPREPEWEVAAAASAAVDGPGGFVEDGAFHPLPARKSESGGTAQMLGDAWEWTASAYAPYPGFQPLPGAFGEYNGKFMVSQMVLRGGSCATPRDHVRTTYRNFFPPNAAWQFTGIRLARDL